MRKPVIRITVEYPPRMPPAEVGRVTASIRTTLGALISNGSVTLTVRPKARVSRGALARAIDAKLELPASAS